VWGFNNYWTPISNPVLSRVIRTTISRNDSADLGARVSKTLEWVLFLLLIVSILWAGAHRGLDFPAPELFDNGLFCP